MTVSRSGRRPRVLLVNKYYHPIIGGVETVVRQYALMLRDLGWDVTILSAKKRPSFRDEVVAEDGLKVIRCSSFGSLFSMPLSLSLLFAYVMIYRGFDCVHFHEPFPIGSIAGIMPFGRRQRVFVTWHSDIVKQKALKSFVGVFQRHLLRRADAITVTSPRMLESSEILAEFHRKARVLPLSIDTAAYKDPGGSLPEGIVAGQYVLYLGRLSYYKGIRVLLEAYRGSGTDLPLVIAGEGTEATEVQRFKEHNPDLNLVFMHKFLTEEDKLHLLAQCAFFVLPSVYASEAFAIIQLEAMIFGKPVINTNLPTGVPWVSLDGLTGLTVPPGDAAALAGAIRKLADSPGLRETLGAAGRARVLEVFDDSVVSQSLSRLYALSGRGGTVR